MVWSSPIFHVLFWSAVTIGFYRIGKHMHGRLGRWWSTPLFVAPALLIALALALNEPYRDYIRQTHWLVALLGPATVAFAVPLWEQRTLIRHHWPALLAGVVAGSATAVASVWAFAKALGLNDILSLSLVPRSISTPFAMTVSANIGGIPDLTAFFVVLTGILGATVGELMLKVLPLHSGLARGALFGMGAHGAGVAKAHEIGREEGSVAGLVMVVVGLLNVLIAPFAVHVIAVAQQL